MNLCECGASIDCFMPRHQSTSMARSHFTADTQAARPGVQIDERSSRPASPYKLGSHRSTDSYISRQSTVLVLYPLPDDLSRVSIFVGFVLRCERLGHDAAHPLDGSNLHRKFVPCSAVELASGFALFLPPHCLKKNAVPYLAHATWISLTHCRFIGRARGPDFASYNCPCDASEISSANRPDQWFERHKPNGSVHSTQFLKTRNVISTFHASPKPYVAK